MSLELSCLQFISETQSQDGLSHVMLTKNPEILLAQQNKGVSVGSLLFILSGQCGLAKGSVAHRC